jgi:hypothetical protein
MSAGANEPAEAPAGDAPPSPRGAYYNKWDRFAETEAAAVKAEEAAEKVAAERCACCAALVCCAVLCGQLAPRVPCALLRACGAGALSPRLAWQRCPSHARKRTHARARSALGLNSAAAATAAKRDALRAAKAQWADKQQQEVQAKARRATSAAAAVLASRPRQNPPLSSF